ncbi:hypothetical protein [Mesorhizobium sp. LSJC269B00]|uniref:hypothetical protein n=1 Tax=Mesorhizobium sp. LSJC269B00 TaxID=1287326 RepID=UPI00041652C8|nr:hypothetical protein [Mesorhizobium sp. LSJC269B00]
MKRFALAIAAIIALFASHGVRAEQPVTIVDDPAVLAALDAKGFGFAGIFAVDGADDLKTLYSEVPAYRAVVDMVAADIATLRPR